MKTAHMVLLAGVGLVGAFAVVQMMRPPPPPPQSQNPTQGLAPGGAGGGQSDYQATLGALEQLFGAVGSVAQAVAKNS